MNDHNNKWFVTTWSLTRIIYLGSCKNGFTGKQCSECVNSTVFGTECNKQCNCNSIGSKNDSCISTSGNCYCSTGYGGRNCDIKCPAGQYGDKCDEGT